MSSLPVVLFVVAALLTLGWFALAAFAGRNGGSPRVTPAPPTPRLGPESPAVVDLITGDWRLCQQEATAATLLDLAARRVLAIEEVGPELSLVRLRRGVDTGGLRPYEMLVLDHVTRLAVDGVVATEALAEGSRDLGRWWKKFRHEVIAEARRLGLSEPRRRRRQQLLLTVATVLPGAAVTAFLASLSFGEPVAVGFLVCVLLSALLTTANPEQGTAAGAAAAGRWLGVADHMAATGMFAERPAAAVTIWGRPMAYAAALGLTPIAVSSLPLGTEASATRAWSNLGGMWHPVEVQYGADGFLGRYWGHRWLGAIRRSVVTAYLWGILVFWVTLAVALLLQRVWMAAPLWAALLGGSVPLALALLDGFHRVPVEGQVLRSRRFEGRNFRSGTSEQYSYWIALDDGRRRRVRAYATDAVTWASMRERDVVRATVGPRLGWIYEAQVLTRAA